MNDRDRQYALLLQKQFESQFEPIEADLQLAAELQEAFNQESNIENIDSNNSLVYKHKKKTPDDGRSLIDPSWELVDPTPNVHNLFVVFNERFFWNKLLSVCVSWSKRMTSCAGICSYQGRGGLCSITLSEPLLKLRPRKDLVETLLHEMIHAYLFVTNNNRDRDGHGPEFHKHMYRINGEAGTSISVYHDFHDEVRLYKQHWWRCNGPCQNNKPFFGMVRRAMNRAPGPNDRWFAEHQRTCGGTFIKVKEPEKTKPEKKSKPAPAQPAKSKPTDVDIRTFLNSPTKPTTSTNNAPNFPKKTIPDIRGIVTVSPKKTKPSISRIVTINSNNGSPDVAPVFNNGNIHGFKSLGNASKSGVGVKSNNSNTVVVTGKGNITGNNPSSSPAKDIDYGIVRNHWLSKFETTGNKRPASQDDREATKKKRLSEVIEILDEIVDMKKFVTCPVCDEKVEESLLNDHLDSCLDNKNTDTSEKCPVCNKMIPKSEYKIHSTICFDVNFDDTPFSQLEECPVCNVNFDRHKIEEHTKSCVENVFKDVPEPSVNSQLTQCSVCSEFVDGTVIDRHTEECLHKMMDDIEDKYKLKGVDEAVCCLVCKKKIVKSELNAHLDECMSGVFDVEDDGKVKSDDADDGASCNKECRDGGKYNCPFCMQMYSELDMSGHLDLCLQSKDDDEEKTVLIDSFSGDDF